MPGPTLISALPIADPLDGTEDVPIVQHGITKQSKSSDFWSGGTLVTLAISGTDPVPLVDGTAAVGASTKAAREDHVHPTDSSRAPLASPAFTGTIGGTADFSAVLSKATGSSTNRTLAARFADVINVLDWGAVADCTAVGVGTNNTTAFQNALAYAKAQGKSLYIPAGKYRMVGALAIDVSAYTSILASPPLPSIVGDGSRATILVWDNGVATGLTVTGSWTGTETIGSFSISGLCLYKGDGAGTGLSLNVLVHAHIKDVISLQWNNGCLCADVLSSEFDNCQFMYNLHGLGATRNTQSEPNAISFLGCEFGGNQNWGLSVKGGSTLTVTGGSIESNGGVGVEASQFGVQVVASATDPQEGSAGATFNSVYFERNAGFGDIYLANSAWNRTLTVVGCTFNRGDPMSTGALGTNCIRLEVFGASAVTRVALIGNGFKGLGTYTASSARPYIGVVNAGQPLFIYDVGCHYDSSLEAPTGGTISFFAPLASPTFTGTPAAPTATSGTNTTQLATTAFVQTALSGSSGVSLAVGGTDPVPVVDGTAAVGTSTKAAREDHVHPTDTSRLAVTTAATTYAPLASPTLTGVPAAPTAIAGTNTTQLATTAYVVTALSPYLTSTTAASTYAPLASPTFTGVPAAPTATGATNTTQIATTAFVQTAVAGTVALAVAGTDPVPVINGTAAVGTATKAAREDHVHPTDSSRAPLASPTFTGTVTIPAGASISGFAPLASPTFTGTPAAPTAAAATNTTQIATTAYVVTALTPYLTSATAASTYAPLASPALTGTPTAPTAVGTTNTTQLATTAFVQTAVAGTVALAVAGTDPVPLVDGTAAVGSSTKASREDHVHPTDSTRAPLASPTFTGTVTIPAGASISGFAPLASPTLTGTPAAPTAAAATNTTQIATTAYVVTALTGTASLAVAGTDPVPLVDGTAAVGTATKAAREDHVHPTDSTRAPLASPTFTGTVTIPAGASISGFAPLASPTFTGTPAAPTAVAGTNTTQLSTTAYVVAALTSYLTSATASSTYEAIASLAADVRAVVLTGLSTATSTAIAATDSILVALGKLQAQVTLRAPLASPTFTGTVTIPAGASISGFAPLASPSFTGTIGGTADFSGVTALSAGSTARSLGTRFSDLTNIKDFGAVGDGVHDETAAFNAALVRGDVYFPQGTYRFASQPNAITVARSLFGAGRTATTLLIDYAAGDFLRMGDGAGNVPAFATVQGMLISCNVNRTSGATIRVFPAHHAVIRDISIQPGGAGGSFKHFNGIQIDGGTNQFGCNVEDFEISLTQGFGIGLRTFPQDVFIRDGIIGSASTGGIDIQSGSGLYFSNIDIINCAYGILCEPGSTDTVVGLFCDAVLGDSSSADNWHFWGTGKIVNVHLTNCWASNSTGAVGFSLNNSGINGLTLTNSTSHGNWLHGVQIAAGKNVTINGCQIGMNSVSATSGANEINVNANVSHVVITGNTVGHVGYYEANGATSKAAFGIWIGSGSGNWITVTSNKVDDGISAPGLCQATGSTVVIRDNLGWKTASSGIDRILSGQQSLTFGHQLVVDDPAKIHAMVSAAVNPAVCGVTRLWAVQPTVGIGGSITVSADAVTTQDLWFTFRIAAFE